MVWYAMINVQLAQKKNNVNLTCDEKHDSNTVYYNNITISSFKENINENILQYLGEFANNTIGIIKTNEFTNYFYNQYTYYSIKKKLDMPLFYFNECIDKIKKYKNLNINTTIFVQILEYNEQKDKNVKYNQNSNLIKSTEYQFFLENGTILEYSICNGLNITVEKKVETDKINKKILAEIDNIYNNTKLNDYCFPLIYEDKELTKSERILLSIKYKPSCDDGCTFLSFDSQTNYSKCNCPINWNKKENSIQDLIEDNEYIASIKKLYETGNIKYFKCFRSIKKQNKKKNLFG